MMKLKGGAPWNLRLPDSKPIHFKFEHIRMSNPPEDEDIVLGARCNVLFVFQTKHLFFLWFRQYEVTERGP